MLNVYRNYFIPILVVLSLVFLALWGNAGAANAIDGDYYYCEFDQSLLCRDDDDGKLVGFGSDPSIESYVPSHVVVNLHGGQDNSGPDYASLTNYQATGCQVWMLTYEDGPASGTFDVSEDMERDLIASGARRIDILGNEISPEATLDIYYHIQAGSSNPDSMWILTVGAATRTDTAQEVYGLYGPHSNPRGCSTGDCALGGCGAAPAPCTRPNGEPC